MPRLHGTKRSHHASPILEEDEEMENTANSIIGKDPGAVLQEKRRGSSSSPDIRQEKCPFDSTMIDGLSNKIEGLKLHKRHTISYRPIGRKIDDDSHRQRLSFQGIECYNNNKSTEPVYCPSLSASKNSGNG